MKKIANPVKNFREGCGTGYEFAHRKNSGFGLVKIDTQAKSYTLDCFKFLYDAQAKKPEYQHPGWPMTIHQDENRRVNRLN